MMATESYDHNDVCNDIYKRLYSQLERKDEERYRFAPVGTAKAVLHHDILMRFFKSLSAPEHTAVDEFGVAEEELVRRLVERWLYDFLAILIFASCGFQAARIFTTRLVAENSWPVISSSGEEFHILPAGREALMEIFDGDIVIVDRFLAKQACFCPVTIQKREEVSVNSLEEHRLPYVEEKQINEGSFGRVYKVKIAKGHLYGPKRQTVNSEHIEIARKDYRISENARIEHEVMKKILSSSSSKCANIVENYGSLRISSTTYSLFMPLALCDLQRYMRDLHNHKPGDTIERAKHIKSAIGLASGLDFLHNKLKTFDEEDLVCYHMDLKPDNILLFKEENNPETDYIWKISDFGMARVKLRNRRHNIEREKDFNSWFVRRKERQDQSSLATLNRRGEGTYLAPESISTIPSMKTESDVWSLGCVISVVFTWLEDGGDGVVHYQDARLKNSRAEGIDRFFLRGQGFTPSKVHPVIKTWHKELIRKAKQRSDREGEAVKYMLDYLNDYVLLIDQTKRDKVDAVERALQKTFRYYKELETASVGLPIRPRSNPDDESRVEKWHLLPSEAFKGCAISPDGNLVAYWTDDKISLYTSESLRLQQPHTARPTSNYVLETKCTATRMWKAVALTKKYLVASTTGGDFQCYIFKLDGGTSVDYSLDICYKVSLPRYEISKLAISPDNKYLACVLPNKGESKNTSRLIRAPISELVQIGRNPHSHPTRGALVNEFSKDQLDASEDDPWRPLNLDWPATDITQILFATPSDIYVAVRPELTVRSTEHKIPIVHIDLSFSRLDTLLIGSLGIDSIPSATLFTAFAPFRQQASTCAVITREKQLHIQSLLGNGSSLAIQSRVKNYRVLRIMMGRHDDKIFALGSPTASHKMLLLEMTIPRSESDKIYVKELAQLTGLSCDDEFVGMLSDDQEDQRHVLVATLAGANQCAIYRVPLLAS